MGSQYLSEIRIMSFDFAPMGWALCNGQILLISQNQALFSLLGTNYGGDGIRTFQLPNLQGRAPLHFGVDPFGTPYAIGQTGGEPTHALSIAETPAHTHTLKGAAVAADAAPGGVIPTPAVALAQAAAVQAPNQTVPVSIYSTAATNTTMAAAAVGLTGGQPHENRQPFLTLNFCISLTGIFPSRS